MAFTATCQGNGGSHYTLTIEVIENKVNQAANTSNVTVKMYAQSDSNSYGAFNLSAVNQVTLTVAGTKVVDKKIAMDFRNKAVVQMASYTTDIVHDTEGKKSITVSGSFKISGSSWLDGGSVSGTQALTNIPRNSVITSASNITLGNSVNVKWTPNSAGYYYKLKFSIGSWSYITQAIHPNSTAAYTYTGYQIPVDVANQITSAASGTMTTSLFTYSDSACKTQIGTTSTKTFTVSVPANIVPSMDDVQVFLVSDNQNVIDWNVYVAGLARARFKANAQGAYGSKISYFRIRNALDKDVTGTSLDYTTDLLTTSGQNEFMICAVDSRGRSSVVEHVYIHVTPYAAPFINAISVERDKTNSRKIKLLCDYEYSSVNGLNSASVEISYKKPSATNWNTQQISIEPGQLTLIDEIQFDDTSSYNLRITVRDALDGSDSRDAYISTIQTFMHWKPGGKGIGFGKVAEDDIFEVAWPALFHEDVHAQEHISDTYVLDLGIYYGAGVFTTANKDILFSVPTGRVLEHAEIESVSMTIACRCDGVYVVRKNATSTDGALLNLGTNDVYGDTTLRHVTLTAGIAGKTNLWFKMSSDGSLGGTNNSAVSVYITDLTITLK